MAEAPSARPTADDFLSIIRDQQRGKLKVYLGSCPGVGKTYSMLVEGNRLKHRGVDVVIGYVEPHERPETTVQIGDLEVIPPRTMQYHGITLKEMDLNAVLARKPTVALVDELAHTNAPESKNRKRYEDIQDLISAGINVISTVNIQHLESLYNIVEQSTGVRVKERIPDEIVTQADQIVNVDLPAEDLLDRLESGKIYPKERIKAAMANFFTKTNLTRLREMTLSETRQLPRSPATGDDRVSGAECQRAGSGNGSDQQPRTGSWPATSQDSATRCPAERPSGTRSTCSTPEESAVGSTPKLNAGSPTRWRRRKRWAAWSSSMKGEDVAQALISFAREYGITHIVVGRPGHKRRWQLFRSSLHNVLIKALPDVDFIIV